MKVLDRRRFLSFFSGSLAGLTSNRLVALQRILASPAHRSQKSAVPSVTTGECWLDVCAPFIVEDPEIGLHSEIVLTSDTFVGAKGYEDGADATEYEIYLYDASGRSIGADGVAKRLVVPAMQMTLVSLREILGDTKNFWGGMRVRLRPRSREPMHASDLFSSAFVRWKTDNSFDNVHANPDPLQWQRPQSFFYSMPFPPLAEYEALFSLFNPYAERSAGAITVYNQLGAKLKEAPYELKPHSSLLFDLRSGDFRDDPREQFGWSSRKHHREPPPITSDGGTIAVTNQQGSVKGFAYLMLKRSGGVRFTVEHPIHQAPFKSISTPPPFDAAGRFKAKNILYTPLVFRAKRIGGVTLDSRFHLSSGAPLEEYLWLDPLITDPEGSVAWQPTPNTKLPATIAAGQIERGIIKLGGMQSCILELGQLSLPKAFFGGLSRRRAHHKPHADEDRNLGERMGRSCLHAFSSRTTIRPRLSNAKNQRGACY